MERTLELLEDELWGASEGRVRLWRDSQVSDQGVQVILFYLLILEGERATLICCSTYLCIHWLILVCSLTRNRTHNLVISR